MSMGGGVGDFEIIMSITVILGICTLIFRVWFFYYITIPVYIILGLYMFFACKPWRNGINVKKRIRN